MPRRFQFSLKTLLFATALCAFGLLLWQLYPFGNMQVESAIRGRPVKFKGSFIQVFGPPEIDCHYELEHYELDGPRGSVDFGNVAAQRYGIGIYRFQGELWPIENPGAYQLELTRMELRLTKKSFFRITRLATTTFKVDR